MSGKYRAEHTPSGTHIEWDTVGTNTWSEEQMSGKYQVGHTPSGAHSRDTHTPSWTHTRWVTPWGHTVGTNIRSERYLSGKYPEWDAHGLGHT